MCVGGRPTRYRPEFVELARKACRLRATKEELGEFFEVSSRTIDYWLATIPEFKDEVQRGRNDADARVANSLYRLAVGFEHMVEKPVVCSGQVIIARYKKCYPPGPEAYETWLRNRRPQNWGGYVRRPGQKNKPMEQAAAFKMPKAPSAHEQLLESMASKHEHAVADPHLVAACGTGAWSLGSHPNHKNETLDTDQRVTEVRDARDRENVAGQARCEWRQYIKHSIDRWQRHEPNYQG